jgi:small-conductance mechanosensitive channel
MQRLGDSVLAAATPTPAPESTAVESPSWVPAWIPPWVTPVVASIVVLALGWLVSRLLVRLMSRRLARRFNRPSLTRTALRGLRAGVFLFTLLVVLRINGLDLGNIALSVTVFSAVVGVILAPIVGSIISGIFLLADQPYEIGDMVELVDGGETRRGFVEDITLRYTKIFTLDNTFLVVPNGNIRERDVYNFSAEDTRTRQTLDVLVTYESDIQTARETIERCARKTEGIIEGGPRIRIGAARYPAYPDCLIGTFGDHGVLLRLRYWVEEPYRMQTLRSKLQTRIWTALEDVDVEIAYPHSHLYFDETSGHLDVALRDEWPERPTGDGHPTQAGPDGEREEPP